MIIISHILKCAEVSINGSNLLCPEEVYYENCILIVVDFLRSDYSLTTKGPGQTFAFNLTE